MSRPKRWALTAAGIALGVLLLLWLVPVPGLLYVLRPFVAPTIFIGLLTMSVMSGSKLYPIVVPVLTLVLSLAFWAGIGWAAGKAADWKSRGA